HRPQSAGLRRAARRRRRGDEEALPQLRPPPADLDAQGPQPRGDRPQRPGRRRRRRRDRGATRLPLVKFEKWQALGNDYLILETQNLPWELNAKRVEWLCDPHFGVGSDGVLLLERSQDPEFVATLRIFNPDGSEAELSGNGARGAILYLRRHGWTDADVFSISTAAGPITPTITSERTCSVDMGRAFTRSKDFPSGGPDGRGSLTA